MLVCLLGSAFFSASETAFSTFNKIRMKNLAQDGHKGAARVIKISENYDKLLSAILIGNNIVNILLSSLGTVLFINIMKNHPSAPAVSTAVITVLVLIFGEITPKIIAKEKADGYAIATAAFISFILTIFTPFTVLASLWKRLLNKIFHFNEQASITEEEIITFIDEVEEDGVIDADEGDLIRSAVEFNDVTAGEILTPRVDIIAIDKNSTEEEITDIFFSSAFSRLPVYENDIDNIIGVLHEKDFFSAKHNGIPFSDVIKKSVYVSEHTKISDILGTLKKEQLHMAIVVDEFGGTMGLVTMEDVIEELIGEVFDEHDEIIEEYKELGDGSYLVRCSANLDDFFEKFGIEIRDDENMPQTLNGWVMMMLEALPSVGESFTYENIIVEVVDISDRRVEEVCVKVIEAAEVTE